MASFRETPAKIAQDTNAIEDSSNRRAVQLALTKAVYGDYSTYVGGTQVTSSAAELNKLDGVSVTAAEMDQRAITVKVEDVSVASSTYVVSPYAGNITNIYAVLGATTVGPLPEAFGFGVVTGGTDVSLSGNVITVTTGTTAVTGSTVAVTAGVGRAIAKGGVFRIYNSGVSTGPTMDAMFTVLVDIT